MHVLIVHSTNAINAHIDLKKKKKSCPVQVKPAYRYRGFFYACPIDTLSSPCLINSVTQTKPISLMA